MSQNWYYQVGGQQRGPVPPAELKRLVTAGKLDPSDLVRREDSDKWMPAGQVKGLFAAPAVTPATPPRREDSRSAGPARSDQPGKQAEPLPLPDEDDEAPRPSPARGSRSHSPPTFAQKAMNTWRRSSTPTKAGILGGTAAVLILLALVPILLLSGGNSSSGDGAGSGRGGPSSTGGLKQGGEAPTVKGSGKLTRLEFVNTLLAKSGNRRVDSLEPRLDRSGGGNVANLGAASRDRQGRVFVHNALGGRFDHDWWVKTFGEFRVEAFFDPTDNEMLDTNDATLRTGKWTYQCSDGPLTFVGSVVEAETSPTGRRLITLRRFGLFE